MDSVDGVRVSREYSREATWRIASCSWFSTDCTREVSASMMLTGASAISMPLRVNRTVSVLIEKCVRLSFCNTCRASTTSPRMERIAVKLNGLLDCVRYSLNDMPASSCVITNATSPTC